MTKRIFQIIGSLVTVIAAFMNTQPSPLRNAGPVHDLLERMVLFFLGGALNAAFWGVAGWVLGGLAYDCISRSDSAR
jgi:hypothetical protein